MSKFIQFDLSQFPLLTPKAFSMPENKEYESKKVVFLVGTDKSPGIYGKDAKLEYDYVQPQYRIQFQTLLTQFKQLATTLQLNAANYSDLDLVLSKIEDNGDIADNQKKSTFQLFKQQLEDILFGMHEAYAQARSAGSPDLISKVTNRIRDTLNHLSEAFRECSEGTTEAIMGQQVLWVFSSDVAAWLLKRRDTIVSQVAAQAVTDYEVGLAYETHAGTAAHLIAATLGYGVASPKHHDTYPNDPISRFKADAPRLLQKAFCKDYAYENICSDVYRELILHYRNLLKSYVPLERLTPHEHDTVRDKLRDLLTSGVCQETDLFTAIPQTNGLTFINRHFLVRLPEYCARYTLLTLEQQGYVKNIGQLPIKTVAQWFRSSLDDRIKSYRPSSSQSQMTLDQWCAQQDSKTILTEQACQGHFFMVFALLNKKHKEAKDEKDAHSFVFNPFHKDKTGESLLALVCRNPQSRDAKDDTAKLILQDWQQAILLSFIFQHPAASCDLLTQESDFYPTLKPARLDRLFNYVTQHCSHELFNLYWDRLISLYQGKGYAALATVLNQVDRHGKTALAYALDSKDSAKIRKIAAIPGVNVKGPVTSLTVCLRDIEAEEFENAFIYFTQSLMYESTSTAVDEKKAGDAKTLFSQWEQCTTLEKCSAIHKPLKHFEPLIQLLKARYGNPEYPHYQKYQAFLQYVAEHEKYVDCLLVLKRENPAIDLDQPRVLRLKTGEEVKETPLRAAIQDDDDPMMTRLLEEALADPDTEVNGESAWLLVANKTNGLSPERQTALLQLLMDKNSISEINLEDFLLQLAASERTDTAFGYILEKLQQDKRHEYHTQLGEFGVGAKEFVTGKEEERKAVRTQQQVNFGREEAKAYPETERIAIAKLLGEACNKIKDSKGHGVLYCMVSTHQSEKLMYLLTATIDLDFSKAFAIPGLTDAEQKEREVKHEHAVNRATVEELLRLIRALQQKPTADYSTALQCFADLYTKQKNPEYYQKLLVIINNHCSKNRAIDFFKQLAAAEPNVSCLQHLRKYVPIDLIKTTHYAARWDCSTPQFATLWQETVASLPDLSHADSQLKLADLVRCMLAEPHPEQAQQQREKLIIILNNFPIIAYLKDYKPTTTQPLSPLDRLISLLQALEQGQMNVAITYYLIDQQQVLTEDITVTKPMARVLTQQWGSVFLKEFTRQLKAQHAAPTGLLQIQKLIATAEEIKQVAAEQKHDEKNYQQAARLLLRHMQSGPLSSRDLLTHLHLLLPLHFIGNNKPLVFDSSLFSFCRSVLAHYSANTPQQFSMILFIMPLDMRAAARLFRSLLLDSRKLLLPENLILEKLKALQQALAQLSSSTHHLSEFFSYMIGQLVFREDFRDYDQLLTYCFTAMNTDHPFCQARREKDVSISSPMHVALHTQHYSFLETLLTPTQSKKLQAAEALNSSPENGTHLMRMVEIKDRAQREKLIPLWLAHDNKTVRVETIDTEDGNNALLKALSSDEKMTPPANEKIALQILEYTLKAFHDDPEKLKQVVEHRNKERDNIFRLASRNKYDTFMLRLLESVNISKPDILIGSDKIRNIFKLIESIDWYGLSDDLIEKFFSCIDQDEKSSGFNTAQVIQVTHIIVKQYEKLDNYIYLFFRVLSQYSHSKEVVSALLLAGSKFQLADILKMAAEQGNVALMQIALDHKPGPEAEFCHATLISLLEESNLHEYHGVWEEEHASYHGTTTFTTPQMAHSVRFSFLDSFLSHDAHLNQERKLTQAIKDCAVKPTCYFTVFLKLFNHDPQNELLAIADQKDLSPPKRIFLNLVQGLSNNPTDKTQLFSAFKQLLLLIENEKDALTTLLSVLKNKLPEERVRLFLNEFLRHENSSSPDPETYLLNTAHLSQITIADSLRVLDEKGGVTLVPPSIQYAFDDCCNFATFLTLLKKSNYPFKNNQGTATSNLSMQKHCVLQMLAPEYERMRRPQALEFLVYSLDAKEFASILSLFNKKAKDLGEAIGDFLVRSAYSARLIRIYQTHPDHLHQLTTIYDSLILKHMRVPFSDTICHLLIKGGCWDEAAHFLQKYLPCQNERFDTPLTLALNITTGDAQQRQAFFQKMADESKSGSHPVAHTKTFLMLAAESSCDATCFQELLKGCPPEVIRQEWRDNFGPSQTILLLAVKANQRAKVRLLLETEAFDTYGNIYVEFDALKQAHQQNSSDIVNIFWEQDKEHKLKNLVIYEYKTQFPLEKRPNLSLASRAFYLLYKDISLKPSYDLLDYNSDFYLAVSQHYDSYAELFPDEKAGVRSFELLQFEFGSHINTLSLAGISLLTYALQNTEAAWLLSYLFHNQHLTISAQQLRLIHSNSKLRQWLIPALQKLATQDIHKAISSLIQCYTDELQTAASASAAGITLMAWVNGLKDGMQRLDFQNLCLSLLQDLGRQLVTRDDVVCFLALYNIAQDNNVRQLDPRNDIAIFLASLYNKHGLILDHTTGDTAITLVAQQGSPQLLAALLAVINKPFTRKNGSGQSVLEIALLRKDKAVIQVILDAKVEGGFDLWPVSEGTDSTLMLAVQLGDLSICQSIETHAQQECKEHFTAFLNYKNAAGKSALYLAVELQQEDIVRWLLTLPGIDREAYCVTSHRTAGLCSYQHAQQDPSTQATTTEAKVEVSAEAAPITMPSASPKVANAILQLFVEHKLVNSATVAVEHQLANIAQRLNHGQQDHAVQALLILVDQQGCQPLKGWLDRLTGSQPETYHSLVAQLSLTALHRAAIDHQHLSVFRDILETKLAEPLADRLADHMTDHMTDRMANIMQGLQKSAILFSETTLDALFADQQLKPLWPAAALTYARACRSRPQHLEKQLPLIQKIYTIILGFPVAEAALYNEILPVVVWELTQAQQQFLITHQASERFPQWYRQIRIDRQAMLQQGIDQGNFDQVNLALTNSKMVLETKEVRYLVDVNNSFTDEKTQQPLVFTVLAKAKQESVHEEDAKHKPFYTIFKMLISHPSWQDDRKDSTRQTLLMHAMTADPRIFCKILDKTTINTLLMPTPKGKTAMDFAWPNAKPAESTTGQTPQHTQEEKNKFENAKNLAAHLRKEFELCMQHIRTLQADPNNKNKNSHGDFSDWATLRAQARKLAIELLKFDEIHTRSLPKNSLVYSSFMSAISQQILLQDIQECQRVLQSGQPLSNADITGRAAKLPQFFIQQLVAAWETIVPSQTAKVEANPAQAKESQLEPPYPEQRLTFPAPSKAL